MPRRTSMDSIRFEFAVTGGCNACQAFISVLCYLIKNVKRHIANHNKSVRQKVTFNSESTITFCIAFLRISRSEKISGKKICATR